jgi:hypothetical protein
MSKKEQCITELVHEWEDRRFYGSVELKFEGDQVVLIRKTETLRPDYRNNRGEQDGTN